MPKPRRRTHSRSPVQSSVAVSANDCSSGTAVMVAICRGGKRRTPTTSSFPRSCCNRRKSTACCRSTPSGSRSTRRSSARRGTRAGSDRDLVPARLQHPATTSADDRPRVGVEVRRPTAGRRGNASLSFKGIGAYTAGAIRSFAFRERAAILDTNVARVLFRVFVGGGDPKSHAMKRHLWTVSAALVPQRHVFDFNQALMDLGAMVCVARNPKCLVCPMAKGCRSFPYNPEKS